MIKKWNDVIQAAVQDVEFVKMVYKFNFVTDYKNGAEYKKEILDEFNLFKKVIAAQQ